MDFIAKNIEHIRAEIERTGCSVTLVAVSKTHPAELLIEAARYGLKIFGESKIQEALPKIDEVKVSVPDAQWHFIGHLQSNKVQKVTGTFDLIHSVDSFYLADKISKAAAMAGIKQEILLELKVSGEDNKFGIAAEDVNKVFAEISALNNIKVRGIMAMAPFFEDERMSEPYFKTAKNVFDELKKTAPEIDILSMGMSHDFRAAIQQGSNMVRIGTAIFGEREYK